MVRQLAFLTLDHNVLHLNSAGGVQQMTARCFIAPSHHYLHSSSQYDLNDVEIYLNLCMLGKNFSRPYFEIFFLFFLENRT